MKHSDNTNGIKVMTPKQFFYSTSIKFTAGLVFIMCICWGALIGVNGIAELGEEKEIIYNFENSFSESRYLSDILTDPELFVSNAYHSFFYVDDETETPEVSGSSVTVDGMDFETYMTTSLQNLYHADKINYFVAIDGKTYTNCGAKSAEELMDADFYRFNEREANGNLNFEEKPANNHYYYHLEEIGYYDNDAAVTVCVSIKDEYAKECEALWEKQSAIVLETIRNVLCFLIAALILLIYLIIVAGKTKEGKAKSQLIDGFWTEVHLALIIIPAIAAVALGMVSLEAFLYNQLPLSLLRTAIASIAILESLILLMSLLSLVRKIKCRIFLETSIIFKVLRRTWKILKKIGSWLAANGADIKKALLGILSKKTGILLITMLLAYTALIGLFGVLTPFAGFPLIFGILLFFAAAFVLAKRAKDIDEVRKGAREVRCGNLQYKIPEIKSEDIKELAEDINDIAEGLERSVADKLKAERMKADLITNVSHDLKTPLTSIINYTALLREVEGLPEEAEDYIAIIEKKSNGLKNLTQDLFEISKVQSGNETFLLETLDAAQLIEQALGEHDNEISRSELPFCVKTEKDLYFTADGRKMSRVLGNLIDNALKYAMPHTRVFLSAYNKENSVVIEIKNISAEPMDFDAEEITARFVRGDTSRTDGGNGLGLAIARSYTEACGGTFRITIDGDLFKATITFPKN